MNIVKPLKTLEQFLLRFFIILILTGCAYIALSQKSDTIVPVNKDPEKLLRGINPREITKGGFNFWQDDFSGHWAGVDFGFNTFLNTDYSGYETEFMQPDLFRSNSAYINIIQQSIGLQRNRNTIGLVTGFGLHFQSYRLNKSTTIHKAANGNIEPRFLYFDQNQKSKFSMFSLIIPLLAEFQIPINHYENRLFISAGPFVSFRLSSHTKIKYRSDRKEKLKVPGHYSIQDLKHGVMIRTGYRWINLFATYDLIPLFKDNKGPEITPFTFGITLIQF